MRAVSVHRDALVVTSRLWQTNATVLRAGGEAVLIDSPYFPDELEALPALLAQAGFEPDGLLATHADFDHLLGKVAFPALPLGVGEETAIRLRAEPGAAQRDLRDHDDELYVTRPAPLSLGAVQALPVPGRLDLGDAELELHPAEGHTADGVAVFARSLGVLAVGDYLSDVEIPMISPGGSIDAYRATLARLAPLVEEADTVVPGHGSPRGRDETLRILDEDADYLDALERGEERPALPDGRATKGQRGIHEENLTR
ncbi:MAG: MBL fold metallo-hydrolase [Thermoleophilaceae bacterium]|nr:MBL fold metallo-hydrolase [Thermoleophilaceae bacterium]